MQARFYAPAYGRFLSPDPGSDQHFEATQSWNIYSYVRNRPTMGTDPSGLADNPITQPKAGGQGLVAGDITPELEYQDDAGHPIPQAIAEARLRAAQTGVESKNALGAGSRDLSEKSVQALEKALGTGPTEKAWRRAIENAAEAKGIDPNLLVGLGFKESTLNPNAVNGEAKGMFQILPARQADLHLSTEDLFTPKVVSAVAGALSSAIKAFHGNTDLAIASWTLGTGRTQSVFAKEGLDGVRNRLLDAQNPSYGRVGANYIDIIRSFQ